jgi:hypothetical protein
MDILNINTKIVNYINHILSLETPITNVTITRERDVPTTAYPFIRFGWTLVPLRQQNVTQLNNDGYKYSNIICSFTIVGNNNDERTVSNIGTRLYKYLHRVKDDARSVAFSQLTIPLTTGNYEEQTQTFIMTLQTDMIIIN